MATNHVAVDGVKVGQDDGREVAPQQGRMRKRKRFQHGNYTGKTRYDAPPYPLQCCCRSIAVFLQCHRTRFISDAVDLGIAYLVLNSATYLPKPKAQTAV